MSVHNSYEATFNALTSKYKEVADIIKILLEDNLRKGEVGYFSVIYRIKTWQSFSEKIQRKQYADPFAQTDDLCGFRIILRDSSKLPDCVQIIKNKFQIKEYQDKKANLNLDQFNYSSIHIVASVIEQWKVAYPYSEIKNIRFEIQIRSELMDTWANISHQISYKKGHLSDNDKRRLYRLSALMEIGDLEITELLSKQLKNKIVIDEISKLTALLDKYVPEKIKSQNDTLSELLSEMKEYNFAIEMLDYLFQKKLKKLLEIEKELFSDVQEIVGVEKSWWQIGVVRGFMYLTIDSYWNTFGTSYREHFVRVIEKYRDSF